jgi:hypothetical protein
VDVLLEAVPGWAWAPRDQAFAEQLQRFKEAVDTGRVAGDRALRSWINAQHRTARAGKLAPGRLKQLRAAGVF